MIRQNKFQYGLVEHGRVREVLELLPARAVRDSVGIVCAIDSNNGTESLHEILTHYGLPVIRSGEYPALPLSSLVEQQRSPHPILTGFDEIWIVRSRARQIVLPTHESLTSDGYDFRDEFPLFVGDTLEAHPGVTVVADGCGLNYATSDALLMRLISDYARL